MSVVLLDVAVCLPKEAETVPLVRAVAKQGLESFGVTGDCVDDLCLALSEACTNVIDHATRDDGYEVRLCLNETTCAISVKNTANGFDAAALDDVMPSASSPRGRGVAIMRAVMDQVAIASEPSAGTIVNLVKRLRVEPDGPLDRLRRATRSAEPGPPLS